MLALYRLFLSTQAKRGRLIGLLVLGGVGVLLGLAVGSNEEPDQLGRALRLINAYGFALFVPVATLVFASSVLGEPNEDGTLVYLWLRPIARWRIVVAALAATLTVTIPVVVLPMALAAGATDTGPAIVRGTLAGCAVATVGYAGVFTWLGLRVKRALLWGLLYILVWEGFVARIGGTAARLAIRANARSLMVRIADGPADLIEVSQQTAIAIPLAAAALGTALAIRRLRRQDVA